MKNILTLNISKAYNLIFSLFLSAAVAIGAQAKAAEGHFEETASYKSWSVGYFEKNNKTYARLITINNGAAFALDFENTTYYATATVLKAEGGRCRNNNSQKEMVNCFLRIDTKDMYSTTCDIEENTNFFLITRVSQIKNLSKSRSTLGLMLFKNLYWFIILLEAMELPA